MNELERTIILLKAEGWPVKQIAGYLNKPKTAIDKRIQRLVKKHNCKSFTHLFSQLSKNGQI